MEKTFKEIFEDQKQLIANQAVYGYCPVCGAPGKMRERSINGNDTCVNGHIYPSATSVKEPKVNNHNEDLLEKLYWEFDSERNKTGEERLTFKGKMRWYAEKYKEQA